MMAFGRTSYAARLSSPAPTQSAYQVEGTSSEDIPTTPDGLHYLPTPNARFQVSPAIADRVYPKPTVVGMSPLVRRKLYEGHMVKVYIDKPDEGAKALPVPHHSIDDMCAHSPVAAAAIEASGISRAHIGHLVLPDGDEEAYVILFSWFNTVSKQGNLIPFPLVTKTPLSTYYEALEISRKLHLSVLDNLEGRFNHMLKSPWSFQSDDIQKAYTDYRRKHHLRPIFVNGIIDAWSQLSERNYRRMKALGKAYPNFWSDLVAQGRAIGEKIY